MKLDPMDIVSDIHSIKKLVPLIHNITNYVVMEQTANCLLAIGASPVMAHALEEVEEMATLAHCVVLNIGTLSPPWIEAMRAALSAANRKKTPVILDPVGVGATHFRSSAARSLLSHGEITAIRGNASEIASFSGMHHASKGVDSLLDGRDCIEHAKELALEKKCIVSMSGKTDVVTDGRVVCLIHNGHPLMGKVTGMGCTATAITGAFLAVNQDSFRACVHASILMGIAGEIAAQEKESPGSFKLAFVDALYNLSLKEIEKHLCFEVL